MGSPTKASRPAGGAASKTTTPATALATGSVIVIDVSAVGSDPLAKDSCTSREPTIADVTRHGNGQLRAAVRPPRVTSPVSTVTKTAVMQKQVPAPTATSADLVWVWWPIRRAQARIDTMSPIATIV